MIASIGTIITPILIHWLVSVSVSLLLGEKLDAAACTTLAALLTLPVFIYLFKRDQTGKEQIQKKWWTYLPLIPAGVFANMIFSYLLRFLQVTENFSNRTQEQLLSSGTLIQIVGVGILVPITEEYLFRGLVYSRLKTYCARMGAVLLGTFLFAVYHGNMIQILYAIPMSLLIIWSYERWGTMKAPIIFHVSANLATIILSTIEKQ